MRRAAIAGLSLLAALAGPAFGAEPQPPERLPPGSTIAGVGVGGLGPKGAAGAVREALATTYESDISIRVRKVRQTLTARDAGQKVEYGLMVERAFDLAARGKQVQVPLDRTLSSRAITAAVRRIGRRWYRRPRNARAIFDLRRVARIQGRFGRRIAVPKLRRTLVEELQRPAAGRIVRAGLRPVRPRITGRDLARIHHTYISIDRRNFRLRLFKRLRVVKRFGIAVGASGFDTPRGMRRVISKQRNPAWHAPNRPWAGQYAGRTIPSGDPRNPLKAAFISLGDGYGIHGTAEEWSIGTKASHGCIRMRVRDVKRLYPRVPVGTRVLIR